MLDRILKIKDAEEDSVFLLGARQTGKTTFFWVLLMFSWRM